MKQFWITIAGVVAGLLLFFIGVPIILFGLIVGASRPAEPAANTILSLDLRQALTDQDAPGALPILNARSLSVMGVVAALHRAESDDRVKGLIVRLPEGGLAPAEADELRLAIKALRAAGKPVYAHSQGVYPGGATMATYMVGAAADQFWIQPSASLQVGGYTMEEPFFKRAFDKYGVSADFQQRYEYKNAVNPLLHDDYTPAHREAELGWMGAVYTSELETAAADRKRDPATLKTALEAGPALSDDAVKAGLADHIGQVNEAESALASAGGAGEAKIMDLGDYKAAEHKGGGGTAIALISAEGEIKTGTASGHGLGGGSGIYSDDVAQAFRQAAKDDAVKAIVLRLSSPGGGDTASEEILAALKAAKAKKPVVVSMGTYAASGGYWVASGASEIVAEPTTLTGSIGVFGGKFVLGPALARFGVDLRDIGVGGDYSAGFNAAAPFTAAQRAQFSAWMDRIYDGFVHRVSEGRRLPLDRVREIAKGRVWTGTQAVPLGLVDKLGGLFVAVAEAKRLAGLAPGDAVTIKPVSVTPSALETVQRALGVGSASLRAFGTAARVLSDPHAEALLNTAARIQAGPEGSTVLAPALPH